MNQSSNPTPSRQPRRAFRRTAIAAALVAALAATHLATQATAKVIEPSAVEQALPSARPSSFADLIERVGPAVVNIATERTPDVGGAAAPPGLPEGTPYREFFERFFGGQGPQPGMPQRPVRGQGSGFVVDAEGHVVTNHHVIDGADTIRVTTHDGRQMEAELVGVDPKTDLALLKVAADGELPHVTFGDSDGTRVGDWVVAIGNPFGLGGTATAGIVSARGRDLRSGPYDDFLQIDAPINRGNSGGPLFDERGQVVGVNSAIFSPNGGNIGIGFAIPADLAKSVIDQLRDDGRVERGWLGVQIQPVTEAVAASLGRDAEGGALVADVVEGSPAAASGLRTGDVITAYDGEPIDALRDLPRRVAETPAGASVPVEVWREGRAESLTVAIGRAPEAETLAASDGDAHDAEADGPRLGLALAELTPRLRAEHGLDDDAEGVLVTRVEPGSPAAKRGLRPGDLLKMVGQTPVHTVEEAVRAVRAQRAAERESVLLLVERGDSRRFVTVDFA
ncbi:MAG: DegQ family serine endoprotease [Gammaproteobacteria bacterium]|nr:DegQ family serine endoprotease [Gammaproteobacteria bacterium]